jgi:hypothetical protein
MSAEVEIADARTPVPRPKPRAVSEVIARGQSILGMSWQLSALARALISSSKPQAKAARNEARRHARPIRIRFSCDAMQSMLSTCPKLTARAIASKLLTGQRSVRVRAPQPLRRAHNSRSGSHNACDHGVHDARSRCALAVDSQLHPHRRARGWHVHSVEKDHLARGFFKTALVIPVDELDHVC